MSLTAAVEGSADRWEEGVGTLEISSLAARVSGVTVDLTTPARVEYAGGIVDVLGAAARVGELAVRLTGRIPLRAQTPPVPDAQSLHAEVDGDVAGVLDTIRTAGLEVTDVSATGPVAIRARIGGSLEQVAAVANVEAGPGTVRNRGVSDRGRPSAPRQGRWRTAGRHRPGGRMAGEPRRSRGQRAAGPLRAVRAGQRGVGAAARHRGGHADAAHGRGHAARARAVRGPGCAAAVGWQRSAVCGARVERAGPRESSRRGAPRPPRAHGGGAARHAERAHAGRGRGRRGASGRVAVARARLRAAGRRAGRPREPAGGGSAWRQFRSAAAGAAVERHRLGRHRTAGTADLGGGSGGPADRRGRADY